VTVKPLLPEPDPPGSEDRNSQTERFSLAASADRGSGPFGRSVSAVAELVRDLQERVARLEASIAASVDAPVGERADWGSVTRSLERIADVLAPAPPEVVGTRYVAQRLACTTVWVAEMARQGQIPKGCILPGTGNGKPWKFYKGRIDGWVAAR
jgi:hypothetical protein